MNNISKYSIEELKKKHLEAIKENTTSIVHGFRKVGDEINEKELSQEATNITLSFCVAVLEKLIADTNHSDEGYIDITNKIQELEKLIENV